MNPVAIKTICRPSKKSERSDELRFTNGVARAAILILASGDYASGPPRRGHGQIAPAGVPPTVGLRRRGCVHAGGRSAKGSKGATSSRHPITASQIENCWARWMLPTRSDVVGREGITWPRPGARTRRDRPRV